MLYLKLFWEFFKTGLFAVGGGMATVPFLRDIAIRTGWFTLNDLADMIAVSESTPGPIGVNSATYVGYRTAGLAGGLTATLGLITPSIIIILIIATVLDKFRNNKYVEYAFYGLRAASVGLIAAAGIGVLLIAFFGVNDIYGLFSGDATVNFWYFLLAGALLYLTRYCKQTKKLHPVVFIALAAVAGILIG